jgi:hypothetical protein
VPAIAALVADSAALQPKLDQLAGIVNRQQTHQDLIDQCEDCRVGANPERQGQNGRERETGMEPQLPDAVLQVLEDRIDPIQAVHLIATSLNNARGCQFVPSGP